MPPGIGAGVYSSSPWETSFLALTEDAGWKSPYGQFFLTWYSNKLIKCGSAPPPRGLVLSHASGHGFDQACLLVIFRLHRPP